MTTFQMWLVGGIGLFMFSVIIILLKYYLGKADTRGENVYRLIEELQKTVMDIRLDLIKNYVTKEELEKLKLENERGHKDLREDIVKYVSRGKL